MLRLRTYRAIARRALKGNWKTAVFITMMLMLLGGALTDTSYSQKFLPQSRRAVQQDEWLVKLREFEDTYCRLPIPESVRNTDVYFSISLALLLVSWVYGGAAQLGACNYYMRLLGGERPPFKAMFSYMNMKARAFGLSFMTGLLIGLWMLLFIIPGIVKAYSYAMAPYIMAQSPDILIMDAITQSRKMMHGHKFRLFSLNLSFLGWELLSFPTFGLGTLFLTPYFSATTAAFYLDLSGQKKGFAFDFRQDEEVR